MRRLKASNRTGGQVATGLRVTRTVAGSAIPALYGRIRTSPILIEALNFQAVQNSGKSGKGKKGGQQTTYTMDADLLLGYGPMMGVGSVWRDREFHLGILGFTTFVTGTGTSFTFNVTTPNTFTLVVGVTVDMPYSVSFNDFGGPGSVSASGTSPLPLHNQAYPAPNNGDWQYATASPYAIYNDPFTDNSVTVVFPTSVSGLTVTVYWRTATGTGAGTLSAWNQEFEKELGTGSEGASHQYVEFSGIGSPQMDLGAANMMPSFTYEAFGLYGHGQLGDCNPADIVADIICSGNYLQGWGNTFPPPVWQHGLNFTNLVYPDQNGGTGGGPYNPAYSRYQGILDDEPNLWGPGLSGGIAPGLQLYRDFCAAYGLFFSFALDSQQTAQQLLNDLLESTGAAACWDGAQLKIIPYCEVSSFANGTSYVSPTAAGPIATFNDNNYLKNASGTGSDDPVPPVEVERGRPQNNFNSLTVNYTNRFSNATPPGGGNYDPDSITVTDKADVSVQGPLAGTSKNYPWIVDSVTATNVGWMLLRRAIIGGRTIYKWGGQAKTGLLSLMDLVYLTDPSFISPIPVRITKVTDNPDFSLLFEGEKFIYGASAPSPPTVTAQGGSGGGGGNQNADPGAVNPPIIFETTPALSNVPQLWFGLSGADPDYGGCSIWLSTDGGSNYKLLTRIFGQCTTGAVYSSNYPSHVDPDATNTLNVDLTESLETLDSFTTGQRDQFESLCYLQGGGTITVNGVTLTIPYELVAYATANLSAANKYALVPTNRRTVFNTPQAAHNIGSDFMFLGTGANIVKVDLDQTWIGVTLHFKFTAFNNYGQNEQDLSDPAVIDYTFTPTGQTGFGNSNPYTILPLPTVYQGKAGGWTGVLNADGTSHTATGWTDPTKVYFPNVLATFNNGTFLKYAARDSGLAVFTNSAGGEQAWVTIADPQLLGEPSGVPTLTAHADLTQTNWNTPGFIRIGTLVSVQYASGGGGGTGGGGGSSNSSGPYVIQYWEGDKVKPKASTVLLSVPIPGDINAVTLPVGLVGSYATAQTAATSSYTITITRNGASIGSITFGAGQATATFTFTTQTVLNPGDLVEFTGQVTPDATLAGIRWAIAGTRS